MKTRKSENGLGKRCKDAMVSSGFIGWTEVCVLITTPLMHPPPHTHTLSPPSPLLASSLHHNTQNGSSSLAGGGESPYCGDDKGKRERKVQFVENNNIPLYREQDAH